MGPCCVIIRIPLLYFRWTQTVCRHWLRGLCMKGNNCGFLHQFDKQKYGLINALNWSQENEKMLEDGFFQENKTIWTILKEKNIFANNIQPKDLENSALSKYIYRDSNQINYKDEDELVDLVKNTSILENRFNFIYYPKIDIAAHVFGVGSKEWQKELNIFEYAIFANNTKYHGIDF